MNHPYGQPKTNVNNASAGHLSLRLLGNPQFFYAGEPIKELRIQKSQALLIYLVVENRLHPGKTIAREKLTDLFWPGMPLESALQNLRQTLYQLRKAIVNMLPTQEDKLNLIESDRKNVWLHPESIIQTDLDGILNEPETGSVPESEGLFLENFYVPECEEFDKWVEEIRNLIRGRLIQALKKQTVSFLSSRHPKEAVQAARRLVHIEPLDESGQLLLLQTLQAIGNRTDALRVYQQYKQQLYEEVGTHPGPEIETYVQQMKQLPESNVLPLPAGSPNSVVKKKIPLWIPIGIAILFVGLLSLAWYNFKDKKSDLATNSGVSIAVLPFENYSDQEFLADGLVDDIVTQLSYVPGIRVTSALSSLQYRNTTKAASQIGEELNAVYLLKGSVQKAGDQVKVNLQMIHAPTDEQKWGTSMVRNAQELFVLQSDVVKELTTALSISLYPVQNEKIPTHHPQAYEAFLEAKWTYQTKSPPENVYEAVKHLERAVTLDTGFVGAYEYMAAILPDLAGGWGDQSIREIYPKVKSILDRTETRPFYKNLRFETIGWIYVWFYQMENAEYYFRKAIETNPNTEGGPASLSIALSWQGKFEEAIQRGQQAVIISPLSVFAQNTLTIAYTLSGNYAKAHVQSQKALALNPYHIHSLKILAQNYTLQGKFPEAIKFLKESIAFPEVDDKDPFLLGRLGVAYALHRDKQEVEKVLQTMQEEYAKKRRHFDYFIAMIYASLQENEKALEWLEIAFKNQEAELNWVHQDPEFAALRQHPQYLQLVTKMRDENRIELF